MAIEEWKRLPGGSACVVAVLLILAAAGCATSRPVRRPRVGPDAIEPTVHFHGGSVAGSLYVVAGPGPPGHLRIMYPADLYVIRGAFADARRLTHRSGNEAGLNSVTAQGDDVMVTDDDGGYIRQVLVHGMSATLGPDLDVAQIPTLGPAGRYVFIEPYGVGHRNAGYSIVYRGRLGRRGRHVVLRTATTKDGGPPPIPAFGRGGQIAVLLGHRLILDAGTSHAHTVTRIRGFSYFPGSYLLGGGRDGMLALSDRRAIILLTPGGRTRVIKTSSWVMESFSPDGRDLLVGNASRTAIASTRLGILSTSTGAITPLASVDGQILDAAWGGNGM